MRLANPAQLPCLPFQMNTPEGGRDHVVIVKLTLDLEAAPPGDRAAGFTHVLKLAPQQAQVEPADQYFEEGPAGSLRREGELAPGKPRCDILVLGAAHAPGGRPRRRFQAGLRVLTPDPVGPPTVLVDKRLQVTGERWLLRRNLLSRLVGGCLRLATLGLFRPCPWKLGSPRPAASVPLRFEYSFGGHVRIQPGDRAYRRVPRAHRPGPGLPAEAWWPANPVGRGFAPMWYLRAARIKRLPGPQIEAPGHPFAARPAWQAMLGQLRPRVAPSLQLQGLGSLSRGWEHRLSLAGTWDHAWDISGSPYPPDFDRGFWNVAHPDLQVAHLRGDEILELTNLCPADAPGATRDARGATLLRFRLPGLIPRLHPAGAAPHRTALDTLILEPGAQRVTLIHRAVFPVDPEDQAPALTLALPVPS